MDFKRFEELRKSKGITTTFLCAMVGKKRGYIKDCKIKGIKIPNEFIIKWADALGTTPEYLRGETNIKTPPQRDGDDENITDDEREELELFRCLSLAGQKRAMSYIRFLREEERAERE